MCLKFHSSLKSPQRDCIKLFILYSLRINPNNVHLHEINFANEGYWRRVPSGLIVYLFSKNLKNPCILRSQSLQRVREKTLPLDLFADSHHLKFHVHPSTSLFTNAEQVSTTKVQRLVHTWGKHRFSWKVVFFWWKNQFSSVFPF